MKKYFYLYPEPPFQNISGLCHIPHVLFLQRIQRYFRHVHDKKTQRTLDVALHTNNAFIAGNRALPQTRLPQDLHLTCEHMINHYYWLSCLHFIIMVSRRFKKFYFLSILLSQIDDISLLIFELSIYKDSTA